MTWLNDTALSAVAFAISRHMAEQGKGLVVLGLIGAGVSLSWAISGVPAGALSDRLGRWRVMLAGAILQLLSAVGCLLFLGKFIPVVVFYCLSGVAGGVFYPGLIAWLGEGESGIAAGRKRATRTLLVFCFAWNLGMICGHFFGGQLFAINPTAPLMLAACTALVTLIIVIGLAREGEGEQAAIVTSQDDRDAQLSAAFARIHWMGNIGCLFCAGIILHLFPDLAVGLEIPSERHGAMLAIMRITIMGSYILMHYSSFWHHRFSVTIGFRVLAILGLVAISFSVNMLMLILGMCALGCMLGFNYFAGVYYSTAGTADRGRGLACGMMEASIAAGMASGSIIGGSLGGMIGSRGPYIIGILALICLLVLEGRVYLRRVMPLRRRASRGRSSANLGSSSLDSLSRSSSTRIESTTRIDND